MKTNTHFFIISRLVLLRMRSVAKQNCRENHNTHFMLINFFFENCAVNEIIWKNMEKPERSQMTIWGLHISRWIPKATNTHFRNMS